jgi:hypothetical protein
MAGMGLPLLFASLLGAARAAFRRSPEDLLIAAFALPYFVVVSAAQSRYARYDIPLLPFLVLWAAALYAETVRSLGVARKSGTLSGLGSVAIGGTWAAAACVVVVTTVSCARLLAPLGTVDPRDRAAMWLNVHAPSPAAIGFGAFPWFWTPPVNPNFTLFAVNGWAALTPSSESERYVYNQETAFDDKLLASRKPPVVVLSEYEYFDRLRLEDAGARAYLATLTRDYRRPIVFADPHPLGGRRLVDGLRIQDLPTDMLYSSPTILVFVRK